MFTITVIASLLCTLPIVVSKHGDGPVSSKCRQPTCHGYSDWTPCPTSLNEADAQFMRDGLSSISCRLPPIIPQLLMRCTFMRKVKRDVPQLKEGGKLLDLSQTLVEEVDASETQPMKKRRRRRKRQIISEGTDGTDYSTTSASLPDGVTEEERMSTMLESDGYRPFDVEAFKQIVEDVGNRLDDILVNLDEASVDGMVPKDSLRKAHQILFEEFGKISKQVYLDKCKLCERLDGDGYFVPYEGNITDIRRYLDNQGPEIAPVNELLAYALFYVDSATKNDLYDIMIKFYTPGEINAAKDTLWKHHQASLPRLVRRVQSAAREAHEMSLNDILDGILHINNTASATIPVFSAVNLSRLPRNSPILDTPEATSVRLDSIEVKMSDFIDKQSKNEDMLTKMSDALNALSRKIGTDGNALPHGPPSLPERGAAPSQSSDMRPSASISSSFTAGAPVSYANIVKQPAAVNDGFREQHKKKYRQRKVVFGSNKDDLSLVANVPTRPLFVYRLQKDTTDETIKTYVEKSVRVVDCKKISHGDAVNASFLLTVSAPDVSTVLDAKFWPWGVGCRRYIPPKQSVRNGGGRD